MFEKNTKSANHVKSVNNSSLLREFFVAVPLVGGKVLPAFKMQVFVKKKKKIDLIQKTVGIYVKAQLAAAKGQNAMF